MLAFTNIEIEEQRHVQGSIASSTSGTADDCAGSHGRLRIYIIATTDRGTAAAAQTARMLGAGLHAIFTLVVAQPVPYRQPIERPLVSVPFQSARFSRIASGLSADATIRICLCRPGRMHWEKLLPPEAIVIIGGARRWWRSGEERLADYLRTRGCNVLFAPVRSRPRQIGNRTKVR